MRHQKKRSYTLEIVFGSLVLAILLAILIPTLMETPKTERASPSGDGEKEEIDLPIERHDPTLGEDEAPVTFVEFVDYQCPICKVSAEETLVELKAYIDAGEVRYVLKDFPLTSHANAVPAAVAARAAGEQGKYWEMHDLLFAQQSEWTESSTDELTARWVIYAEKLGLDVDKFKQDLASDPLKDQIVAGRQLGDVTGVRSTPTTIVNGVMYEGLIKPDELHQVVKEAKQ